MICLKCGEFSKRISQLEAELAKAKQWIDDLHSGMYVNCVYCGHRYGPDPGTPVAMADVLKQHIERCPSHPMSALRAENDSLRIALAAYANEANWEQGGSDGGNLWTGAEIDGDECIWGADIAQKALENPAINLRAESGVNKSIWKKEGES